MSPPRTRTARLRSAAAIAVAALGAPFVCGFAKGPYLQGVDGRGATVVWQPDTVDAGEARITVRRADTGREVARTLVQSTACADLWEANVGGLQPGTRYRYTLEQDGQRAEGFLNTAPPSGRPFTAAIYGDNRSDPRAHAAVVSRVTVEDPDFLVHTGDLVVAGSIEADWASFFDVAGGLLRDRPLFPVSGNHERAGDPEMSAFRHYFHLPGNELYYAFTWGNLRFIGIDVNVQAEAGAPDTQQTLWLTAQVKRAESDPAITHTIAFLHQGPFSSNPARTGNLAVRQLLHDLYDLGLDLLVCGHDHFYERGLADYGLPYLVVGSGGAPLYPTRGPGRYEAYEALVSKSQHAFVKLRSTGRAVSLCAVDLDGLAFDCFDLPRHRGRRGLP